MEWALSAWIGRFLAVREVVDALEDFAEEHPDDAAATLEEAYELLDILSQIFNARGGRRRPRHGAHCPVVHYTRSAQECTEPYAGLWGFRESAAS